MTCEDKVRFTSKHRAKHAARVVSSEGGIQMRAYACPECHGWHLSSVFSVDVPRSERRHWQGHARRLAPGQSLEDLAAQIRAERAGV